jgi:solute carrier family 35 protein C2
MPSSRNEELEMTDMDSGNHNVASSTRRRGTVTGINPDIAGDIPPLTPAELRLANRGFFRKSLGIFALICCWYIFSISITVVSRIIHTVCPILTIKQYNKWMFQDKGGEKVFPFPLFTTCIHMIVQFSLASLVLFLIPSLRPRHGSVNPHLPVQEVPEPIDYSKPLMTKMFYLTKIGPCGLFTGLDIGLGNFSLRFITLTFYSTLLFYSV